MTWETPQARDLRFGFALAECEVQRIPCGQLCAGADNAAVRFADQAVAAPQHGPWAEVVEAGGKVFQSGDSSREPRRSRSAQARSKPIQVA